MNNPNYKLDAAEDLLMKMMMKGKGERILDKISKFESAGIIKLMVDKGLICGKTNNEIYEMYSFVADKLKLDVLTKDNLMKTLVNFYGFKIINRKINGKKYRVLTNDSEEKFFKEHTVYCLDMLSDIDVYNQPTNKVYKQYQEYCISNNLNALSAGEFSKQVKFYFNCEIINKKIHGKKYRIFINKGSR